MKQLTLKTSGALTLIFGVAFGLTLAAHAQSAAPTPQDPPQPAVSHEPSSLSPEAQKALVQRYCVPCHDDAQQTGDVSLEHFEGADHIDPLIAALMTRKLKTGQMPPPDQPRPDKEAVDALVAALEPVAMSAIAKKDTPAPAAPIQVIPFPHKGDAMPVTAQNAMVHQICTQCHNDRQKAGGISMEPLDMATVPDHAELAERMIAKLRAGMMPPPTAPKRPDVASIHAFAVSLENRVDRLAAQHPDPGFRDFQQLNRAEYARSIRTMLGLDLDVSRWLPPDTMSHNFDNIAEAQSFSPTLLQSYLSAADQISRLAVGDPTATPTSFTYDADHFANQTKHVADAPIGTRGGISVVHVFPADGTYRFKLLFYGTPVGNLFGLTAGNEQIEIAVNGRRMALLDVDPRLSELDRQGLSIETPPIQIEAGPQQISAAFVKHWDGPVDDLIAPHQFSLADPQIGEGPGITTVAHLRSVTIAGPFKVTGVSETVSRERIFVCRPVSAADEIPCARRIVTNLATQAYRRPATPQDIDAVMRFYEQGRKGGDFESGVRTALQAILASPDFLFRIETKPAAVHAMRVRTDAYRIDDVELASRLSYFLWALPPDADLLKVASAGRLHEPAVFDAQVRRMLKDPRSMALSTRFASLWLRLQDTDKVHPDALMYADYDGTLAHDMKRETQLFFDSIVKGDRSVLDLLTADYTFLNQNLAAFYGIKNVAGDQFRRVSLEGTHRRGLLGQGSILVETSVADRTSPVLRGKWVLEVLLGSPPPPPPPNVPPLDDTNAVSDGKPLSVRERMEEHRKNPACASCHRVIDPIGLALENFDPTGHWRTTDNGVPVDPKGQLYDGSKVDGLEGLDQALLKHQDTFIRVFTENLMAYAIGRPVQYFDMPTIRSIDRTAAQNSNRFSSFILGIVKSPAFRMKKVDEEKVADNQKTPATQAASRRN
jgi:hypothetical protein